MRGVSLVINLDSMVEISNTFLRFPMVFDIVQLSKTIRTLER